MGVHCNGIYNKRRKGIIHLCKINFLNDSHTNNIYQYDLNKLMAIKAKKSVEILGNLIVLDDKQFKYLTFNNMLLKNVKILMYNISTRTKFVGGIKDIDMEYAIGEFGVYALTTLRFLVMHLNDASISFVLKECINTLKKIVDDLAVNYQMDYSKFNSQVSACVEQYRNDLQKTGARAVGSELATMYCSSNYAEAAIGSFVTQAVLDNDIKNAKTSYDNKIGSIKFNYSLTLENRLIDYINDFNTELLNIIFRSEFSVEELKEINELSKNDYLDSKEIFLKYPFIINNYKFIISNLGDNDYDNFIEILKYYDIVSDVNLLLRYWINNNYDILSKRLREITVNEIKSNCVILYCKLEGLDVENYVCKSTFEYLNSKINNIFVRGYDKLSNLCDVASEFYLYKNILSEKELNYLLDSLNKYYYEKDVSLNFIFEILNKVKDNIWLGMLLGVVLSIIVSGKSIYSGNDIEFSVIFGGFVIGVLSLIFYEVSSIVIVMMIEFDAFKYNLVKLNSSKFKKKIGIILILLICLLFLLL